MTRAIVRPLLAAVVAFAVTVCAVPTAEARPLETSGVETGTSWLDTALAFFGTLLTGDEVGLVTLFMAGNGNSNGRGNGGTPTDVDGPGGTTQGTGACIDPNGMPTICSY